MRVRNWACWALVVAGVAVAPVRAQDAKPAAPTVAVRVKSIDGLFADVQYLAGLVGQEEQAKQLKGILDGMAGPKGLTGTGIDTKRPLGLYGVVTPGGVDSYASILVPVADEKAFIELATDLLRRVGATVEKGDDGIYTVKHPSAPVEGYFTFAERYAYVTAKDKDALTSAKRVSPARVLTLDENTLAAVTVRIDQIPDMIKQIALGQIELQMANAKDRKEPNETPAQTKLKVQLIDHAAQRLKSLLGDGQSLNLSVAIDRKADDIAAEFNLTAKPGTALAKQIASHAGQTTTFGGFRNLAFQAGLNVAIPEELRGALAAVVDEGFRTELNKQNDPAKKELARKVFDVLGPIVKAGRLELFAGLRGPDANGHFTFGTALRVPDGKAIEGLVKELVPQLPPKEREAIKLDADSVAGTSIHRAEIRYILEADPEARRILGDKATLLAAFPREAVVIVYGADAPTAIRAPLADRGPQPAPPFSLEASVARLATLDKKAGPEARKIAADVFGGEPQGQDLFRATVEGGPALRVRLVLKGQAIKFGNSLREKVEGK